MYRVQIANPARKQLLRLDPEARRRVREAIDGLGEAPRPSGAKKVKGSTYWRVRVGNYRIIYRIEDKKLFVLVVKVGHRKEVYRSL